MHVVVDRQHLAGYRFRRIGREEYGQGRDVAWSTSLLIDWTAIASCLISSSDLPLCAARPSKTRWMRGPSTAPGRMALARMPCLPSSIESVFVKPIMPHFVVQYGLRLAYPNLPATDDMLMMTPALDFLR